VLLVAVVLVLLVDQLLPIQVQINVQDLVVLELEFPQHSEIQVKLLDSLVQEAQPDGLLVAVVVLLIQDQFQVLQEEVKVEHGMDLRMNQVDHTLVQDQVFPPLVLEFPTMQKQVLDLVVEAVNILVVMEVLVVLVSF
tara:strand:+ start:629 stop:1042 length:414 start_codon:yes stop_codon:yes gene_type:complete